MGTMFTPVFRVSFPSVFRKNEKSTNPKYEVVMLFSKETKAMTNELARKFNGKPKLSSVKELQDEVDRIGFEKWGEKYKDPKFKAKLKLPFHDGADKEYDGYGEGVVFCTARSGTQPGLMDAKAQRIIDPELFYAGCYAIASVNVYATDRMFDGIVVKAISIGLGNIQKVGEGEPFSGRARAEEEFEAIDEPSDEDASELSTDDL